MSQVQPNSFAVAAKLLRAESTRQEKSVDRNAVFEPSRFRSEEPQRLRVHNPETLLKWLARGAQLDARRVCISTIQRLYFMFCRLFYWIETLLPQRQIARGNRQRVARVQRNVSSVVVKSPAVIYNPNVSITLHFPTC
jgi:hypothetical protein